MTARIILRVFGCCAIAVLVLEACARVDDYVSFGASLWAPYNSDTLYQMDDIGKHGKPNARYRKWQLNSLGYRGPDLKPAKINIACFGSSETFGLYESPGEEYPRQLEREIQAKTGSDMFQVTNVAYPGEAIPTATRRIPEVVETMHPRFAFMYPSPATYIWLPWLQVSKEETRTEPITQPSFEWRIAENVRVILKELIPNPVQFQLRQIEIRQAAAAFPNLDRVPDENIELFTHDLDTFVNELRANGVEPILVTHATYFGREVSESDRQMLAAWRKFYPMLKEEGFLDMEARANNAIKKIAKERVITLVDAAAEVPSGNEYFADFVHFTDKGSHAMAVKLALSLKETQGKPNIPKAANLQTSSTGTAAAAARKNQ